MKYKLKENNNVQLLLDCNRRATINEEDNNTALHIETQVAPKNHLNLHDDGTHLDNQTFPPKRFGQLIEDRPPISLGNDRRFAFNESTAPRRTIRKRQRDKCIK